MKVIRLLAVLLGFCCFTTSLASIDDSYKNIQAKGKLVIGLDETFAPMGFRDKNGQLVGFDIDLAKEVARRLKCKIVFQSCVWDSIFFELKNGTINAIWNGLTISKKRKTNALFSKPYMTNNVVIVVKKNSPIKKLKDLQAKKIATQAGAPPADYIQNYQGPDLDPKKIKQLVQYPDFLTALYDLTKGGVDAVAVDEILADYYITQKKLNIQKLPTVLATEQIGIAFRKTDVALRDKIQATLDAMIKDGTAANISKKWFGRDVFSINPT